MIIWLQLWTRMFYYYCTCSCKSKLVVNTTSKCIMITRWNVGLINCLYMSFILTTFFICQILLHEQKISMHQITHFKLNTTTQHIWSGNVCTIFITTLALGSQPKQGLTRVRAKREAWDHISCWHECRKVWGNEPPHSQVSSHFGS